MSDISFIYVNDYKSIKKQSFNFDGEYYFTFDPTSKEVTCTKNRGYISNYFNQPEEHRKSEITNITAIIGQNGSGKSTFLEFLAMTFRSWGNFHPAYAAIKDVIIIRIQNFVHITYGKTAVFRAIESDNERWSLTPESLDELSTDYHNHPKEAQNNQFMKGIILPIYYSSSLTDRVHQTEVGQWDIVNVSNTYMYYASQIPVEYDKVTRTQYRRLKHPGNFILEDNLRNIIFLKENSEKKYLPKMFRTYNYFSIAVRQGLSNESTFKQLFIELYKKYEPKNDIEFLRLQIVAATIHGLVHPRKNNSPPDARENYMAQFNQYLSQDLSLEDLILRFLVNHEFRNTKQAHEFSGSRFYMFDYRVKEKEEFVKYLFKTFLPEQFREVTNKALENFKHNIQGQKSNITNVFFNPFRYFVKLEYGQEFCDLYKNILEELTSDFIEISFELSAGETAFLTFFSRLHYGFKSAVNAKDTKSECLPTELFKKILLIIDEAEIYFHPQWQKEYLSVLIEYVRNLFEGIPVQIVVSSNSPFITSDLPAYNIIFLEPNNEGNCIVSSSQNHKNTLGANIYQLFQDAFYLKDGFMGNVADRKIQEVFEKLCLSKRKFMQLSPEERTNINQIISNIGEPGIRSRLEQLYIKHTLRQ